MSKVHRLEFDGYTVGDRLLDGVSYAVELEEIDNHLTVKGVSPWDEADAAYLESLNSAKFEKLVWKETEELIVALEEYCSEEGITLQEIMDEFEADTGEPGIQVLLES